jgi:hypothetical protein
VSPTGVLSVLGVAPTVAGTITAGSWQYIEASILQGGTGGAAVTIRKNGAVVSGPLTDQTISSSGSFNPQILDKVQLRGIHSTAAMLVDDLYLRTGTLSGFEGDPHPGVNVKAWNGSAYVDGPTRVWSGLAYADALAVKTWNGTAFV